MPVYNLLECSINYSMTSKSLWIYYRDDVNDAPAENVGDYRVNNNKLTTSRSFQYKTKIIGRTPVNNNRLNIKIASLLLLLVIISYYCCYCYYLLLLLLL